MILENLIKNGGAVMWPLLVLAFFSVLIIADRLFVCLILNFSKKKNSFKVSSFLRLLDFISQVAPVIGFLGTVTGIMNAFKGMSTSSSVGLQSVSAGMYEALFTTAAGLVISITDSVCFQLFSWWGEYLEKSCKI